GDRQQPGRPPRTRGLFRKAVRSGNQIRRRDQSKASVPLMFSRAIFALLLMAAGVPAQPLQKITINYASRTGTTWPLYIAKEAGYFQKYGLDVEMAFAVHPAAIAMVISGQAAMTNYPLEQAMLAGSTAAGSLLIVGSPYRKSL